MLAIQNDTCSQMLGHAPDLLSAADLVKIGLYPSTTAIYKAKERGACPPFVYVGARKLRFPKDALLSWLFERHGSNDSPFISAS